MKRSGLLLLMVLLMIMLLSANLYSEGQLEGSRSAEYVGDRKSVV